MKPKLVAIMCRDYVEEAKAICVRAEMPYVVLEPIEDPQQAIGDVLRVDATHLIVHGFLFPHGSHEGYVGCAIAELAASIGVNALCIGNHSQKRLPFVASVRPHEVERGAQLLSEGGKAHLVAYAQGLLNEGRILVSKGQALMQRAEESYRD